MLRFVTGGDMALFPKLRTGMFQDRAWQFRDRLGWPVHVDGNGEERDEYDTADAIYVVWQKPDGGHGGSMRLRPTTGRTMVNDHFLNLTGGVQIRDTGIWECTRFCLAKGAAPRVASALMLGGGEFMERFAVRHFVGVFDAPMRRIYQRIGASPEIIGSSGLGRAKTSVGLWAFSSQARARVALSAGLSPGLVKLWFDRSMLAPTEHALSA